MFSRIWTKPSTKSCSEQLERLQTALRDCDSVVIGAGAGIFTSTVIWMLQNRSTMIF